MRYQPNGIYPKITSMNINKQKVFTVKCYLVDNYSN